MYQKCKLIHADLSEYNMLWHDNKVWFIDVSQSVEPFHPHALEFLYRDCTNVVEFFTKCGVPDVLTAQGLFNEVTQLDILTCAEQDFLSQVHVQALSKLYTGTWAFSVWWLVSHLYKTKHTFVVCDEVRPCTEFTCMYTNA